MSPQGGTSTPAAGLAPRPGHSIRVTAVHPIPLGNFTEFFDELGRSPSIDLTVLFCSADPGLRATGSPSADPSHYTFKSRVLPGFVVAKPDPRSVASHLNPSIIRAISPRTTDVLVVYGYSFPTAMLAIAIARARRIPWILGSETHWDSIGWGASGIKRRLKEAYVRSVVASASAFFPAGTLAARFLVDLGASPDSLFRVGVPCDIERWRRMAMEATLTTPGLRAELSLGTGPVISTVTRLLPHKGVEELIRGFAKFLHDHEDWNLLIVGEGPGRSFLERFAVTEGAENVRFTGALAPHVVAEVLAASEIFCLPSRREPWGVVVNEALAAGVPVVATRKVGAAADLIEPTGAGLVVPDRDASALCEAFVTLADDPEKRALMQARTWAAVLPFSTGQNVSNYTDGCYHALRAGR